MTFVLALLTAIVGCAIGAITGTVVASLLAPAMGVSSFEGEAGYFAVFIGGGLGGITGLITGAAWMLRRRGVQGFGAIAGRIGLVFVGFVGVVAGGIGLLYLGFTFLQDRVNPNGLAPQLAFEIRLPAGAAPPSSGDRPIELDSQNGKRPMPALMQPEASRVEDGRAVLVGLVEMYYRSSSRRLIMTLPDKTDVLFDIKLPRVPKHAREFGDWQRAVYIGEPGQSQARRVTDKDNYEIRYRAEWAGEE